MGNRECGRLKGNPCGPLRLNTINVTMPPAASPQQAGLRAGKVEVMSGETTPLPIVSTAEELIGIRDGGGADLWPKTSAVLGRQALEGALRDFWLAQETSAPWSAPSRACHHHSYELSPTAGELRAWLTTARTFAEEVGRQVASGERFRNAIYFHLGGLDLYPDALATHTKS